PQHVPTYVADPRCRSGGFQEAIAEIAPAKACADRARENEIVSTHCLACLPLQERTKEELRHRENAHAGCSFWRRNLSLVQALVNDDRLPLPIDLAPAQSQYLADPFLLASRCFGCKPEYVHVLTAHLLTHIDLAEFVLFSNLPNAFQALACCSGVERYCDQFDVRLKGILDVAAVQ